MVFLFLLDALIFLRDLQITDCKPHLIFFSYYPVKVVVIIILQSVRCQR